MTKIFTILISLTVLSSCLKTREDIQSQEQQNVYSEKMAENQIASQKEASKEIPIEAPAPIDEKDQLIRSLNGRVEVLENQLSKLSLDSEIKDKELSDKINLLQEGFTKLESQASQDNEENPIAKEVESTAKKLPDSKNKLDNYGLAQNFFSKKEWKKAILSYQKHTEENPKAKNVADAKYKIGFSFQQLGMKEEAMAFYEEVIATYSKTEAAKLAKSKLSKLK